jgi:hypothetical protein
LKETRADLDTLCGSLVERYKQETLTFHFHYFASTRRLGADGNFCAIIGRSERAVNMMPRLGTKKLRAGGMSGKHSKQEPSVFVDVAECIEDLNGTGFPFLPVVVRLQSLDLFHRICGDSSEPMPSNLALESSLSATNGEHVLYVGCLVRSKHKFPHQIIEGRPQILNTVPEDERNGSGDGSLGVEFQDDSIRLRLFLGHHFARLACEIPKSLPFESLKVLFGPDDFLPHGIERGHWGARL